jgi:very-short-patch-repair endonuclease
MKDLHNRDLTFRAQELRTNATKQENHLWYDYLNQYPVRFRRQVTIDRFIVDFLCSKAMLVLEVDGSQHYTEDGEAYDKDRTAILEALGYSVLRVSNDDVDRNFSGVCELIDNVVRKRIQILEKK